jgi:hypothetical protein
MSNKPRSQEPNWTNLVWAAGGAIIGVWWVKNQTEDAKKSRAERDDPDGVKEVCEEIAPLLDIWEPDENCQTEGDFVEDLAEYLQANTDWEIEVAPDTPEGQPDILIGDLLALELKINPSKNERDRCVGQCAGYSRLWVTWIILIDASASTVGRLEDLLADKGLDRILVWNFA